jgi:flagellar motor protein MotB
VGKSLGARWLVVLILPAVVGCAENSLVLKGQVDKFQQQQVALSRQKDELQTRASALDKDNQDLITRLTQERQRSKVLEDQLAVLRDQFGSTNAQLARLMEEKKSTEQKVQALTASLQRQGSAPIVPNNSLLQTLPALNLPDVFVRRDGDVIRIELPAHRLFDPGGSRLSAAGSQLLLSAASEILRTYPRQILGIEGHTELDPTTGAPARTDHQLAMSRAAAVYDALVTQGRVQPAQLFLVAHGANHPVFSNGSPAGRQRNARVELVVYPETVGGG